MITLSDFLEQECKPAFGCTEPASIAYAASLAAQGLSGDVVSVRLRCDPRIYKNCYAVGIPNSDGKTGILWTTAIGCLLPNPSLELECLRQIDEDILHRAADLVCRRTVSIEADTKKRTLYVDCEVHKTGGHGRAVIEGTHTHVVLLERNGFPIREGAGKDNLESGLMDEIQKLSFGQLIELAESATGRDHDFLEEGIRWNLAISNYGAADPRSIYTRAKQEDDLGLIRQLVFSGVHARMSGANYVVMSSAGSGNKGITCAVPVAIYGKILRCDPRKIRSALALAFLMTSLTTRYLGTLSAICGCSNAAGIGLAAGLVYLQGGNENHISHAVSNMVGNISGIICDGAKIGCALKAMTAVDSAFRAASLALKGIAIPVSDGIVGENGRRSLEHLGRIATLGMGNVDAEILKIMKDKLEKMPING